MFYLMIRRHKARHSDSLDNLLFSCSSSFPDPGQLHRDGDEDVDEVGVEVDCIRLQLFHSEVILADTNLNKYDDIIKIIIIFITCIT